MSNKPQEPDYYDQVWEILKVATLAMKGSDIPSHEVPPALADWLVYTALAIGQAQGLSEQMVLALIERQLGLLDRWRDGLPPFSTPEGALS